MLKYSKEQQWTDVNACCVSSNGGKKVAYSSQAEAGTVANKLGSKVYQCRVNTSEYHITSQGTAPVKVKQITTTAKDIKREKRKAARELNTLLAEVIKQLDTLYEQKSSWSKEQLDEFYRREQELLTTEELLIEEIEEDYIWMRVLK